MRFGKGRAAIAAAVIVCGAMALVPFVSAQTRERDPRYDLFGAFGAVFEIGVSVRELTIDEVSKAGLERAGGVYVQSVREDSPAARADIRNGDLIVRIDGERVRGVRHFVGLVSESPAGRGVRIEIIRGNARSVVDVTPEAARFAPVLPPEIREEVERRLRELPRDFDLELPAPRTPRARLGITTNQLAEYFRVKEGVLVSAVEQMSPSGERRSPGRRRHYRDRWSAGSHATGRRCGSAACLSRGDAGFSSGLRPPTQSLRRVSERLSTATPEQRRPPGEVSRARMSNASGRTPRSYGVGAGTEAIGETSR